MHGLQCHIVKSHEQPKGTIGSLEKALDRYGVPVREVEEYEKAHGEGSAGTMADPKNMKIKQKTKELRAVHTNNAAAPQPPHMAAMQAPYRSGTTSLGAPMYPHTDGRNSGGFVQEDIESSDDEESERTTPPKPRQDTTAIPSNPIVDGETQKAVPIENDEPMPDAPAPATNTDSEAAAVATTATATATTATAPATTDGETKEDQSAQHAAPAEGTISNAPPDSSVETFVLDTQSPVVKETPTAEQEIKSGNPATVPDSTDTETAAAPATPLRRRSSAVDTSTKPIEKPLKTEDAPTSPKVSTVPSITGGPSTRTRRTSMGVTKFNTDLQGNDDGQPELDGDSAPEIGTECDSKDVGARTSPTADTAVAAMDLDKDDDEHSTITIGREKESLKSPPRRTANGRFVRKPR